MHWINHLQVANFSPSTIRIGWVWKRTVVVYTRLTVLRSEHRSCALCKRSKWRRTDPESRGRPQHTGVWPWSALKTPAPKCLPESRLLSSERAVLSTRQFYVASTPQERCLWEGHWAWNADASVEHTVGWCPKCHFYSWNKKQVTLKELKETEAYPVPERPLCKA